MRTIYEIVDLVKKSPGEQGYWIGIVTKDFDILVMEEPNRLRAIQQLAEAFPQYRNRLFTEVIGHFSDIVLKQKTEDDKLAVIYLLATWFQQKHSSKPIDTLITKATLNGIDITRISVEVIYQLKSPGEKDFPKNMDELNAKLQSLEIEISESFKNKVMELLQVIDNLLVEINTNPKFNLGLSPSKRKSITHTDTLLWSKNESPPQSPTADSDVPPPPTNGNAPTSTNGM